MTAPGVDSAPPEPVTAPDARDPYAPELAKTVPSSRITFDPSLVPDVVLAPGEMVADTYRIERLVGQGGMGQVFEANDRHLNRKVAIKVAWTPLHGHGPASAILHEAQALAAIRHPGLVTVHGVGVHRGITYMVMEFIRGVSLADHLARLGNAGQLHTLNEAVDLLIALTEALRAVHGAGIAHRDVKPANVVLVGGNRLVLTDLGIFAPECVPSGGADLAGTPHYMAPESILGQVMPGDAFLVDLYALGVVAFEVLTGKRPFDADSVSGLFAKHVSAIPPDPGTLRPGLPPRLRRLVPALLAKDPKERPHSAEEVLWQLRSLRSREDALAENEPFSVLIVDDDPDMREALGDCVRDLGVGAEVRSAPTPEHAIAEVRRKPPQVMLLDLEMPGMSGTDLCLHLRATHLADRCTIVSVSGTAEPRDLYLLNHLGVRHFLAKDANLMERLPALMNQLRRQATSR